MSQLRTPDHDRLRPQPAPARPVGAPGKLTDEQMEALRRYFPSRPPAHDTSPIQAGFALGVEAVLEVLRTGWVPR